MRSASVPLDDFDRAILAIVQQDAATPQRVIGAQVNLSAPAVQRRLKRMEAAGVITGTVAVLDPAAVGLGLTIVVSVQMESERLDLIDAAKASFRAAPEVQQCYYVTGEADFVLICTVASMAEYEALARRLFFDNANVKRFQTLVAMDRVKASLSVCLD